MALLVVVQVGSADADAANSKKDHAGREIGAAEGFDANIAGGMEDGGLHGVGHA
jgi:hypothetical protein